MDDSSIPVTTRSEEKRTRANSSHSSKRKVKRNWKVGSVVNGRTVRQCTFEGCTAKFTHSSKLKRHLECVHLKAKPYECGECRARFSRNDHLKRHALSHCATVSRTFACDFCSRRFALKHHCKRHIAEQHSAERKHKCQHCAARFGKRRQLTHHFKYDCVERPDDCGVFYCKELGCARFFFRKGDLKRHCAKSHGSFQCKLCTAAPFKRKSRLSRHKVIAHSDATAIDSFLCALCFESLASQRLLDAHISDCHSDTVQMAVESKFECRKCQQLFTRKFNLDKHLKTVHCLDAAIGSDASELQCPVCGKRLKHSGTLKKHLQSVHSHAAVSRDKLLLDNTFGSVNA